MNSQPLTRIYAPVIIRFSFDLYFRAVRTIIEKQWSKGMFSWGGGGGGTSWRYIVHLPVSCGQGVKWVVGFWVPGCFSGSGWYQMSGWYLEEKGNQFKSILCCGPPNPPSTPCVGLAFSDMEKVTKCHGIHCDI